MTPPLAPFSASWPETARALHGYAQVLTAVPRAHAPSHPHWWHIGLTIDGASLVTVPVPLPDRESLRLGLAPAHHAVWMQATSGFHADIAIDGGMSANDLAGFVMGHAAALGLADAYDRERFASDEVHRYERAAAEHFWQTLTAFAGVFERRRAELDGAGPIHLWSHHFDMSFEWYGSRMVEGEDGSTSPAQINLGLNTLDEQYVYSSPWPFDSTLTDHDLPGAARWHTEGWTGSELPYDALLGRDDWDEVVLEYSRAVFDLARPGLV